MNPKETYTCNLVELKNDKILEHENFERTFAGSTNMVLKKPLFDKFFTKGRKEDTDDELCDVGNIDFLCES